MKFLLAVLLLFSPIGFADNHWEQEEERYIVILLNDYDPADFIASHEIPAPERVWEKALKGFTIKVSPEMTVERIKELALQPEVDFVEKDNPVYLEPHSIEDDDEEEKQTIPWGIERVGTFICKGICRQRRAFVIDTGIDLDHEDLRVIEREGFTAFEDDTPDDGNGHGTHVAGTIGAKNNSIGVVGVAAGARLVPVKVLNAIGRGSNSTVLAGINFVAENARRGDVANMSLGGAVSEAIDKAVINTARQGIFFTLAAGNRGLDASGFSPARANGPNIFTISAFDQDEQFAPFSNFGLAVDKAEPGVAVLSTYRDNGYRILSGTSMAAPHAAGILLRTGRFGRGCEEVQGDPDETPDCIGVLPTFSITLNCED